MQEIIVLTPEQQAERDHRLIQKVLDKMLPNLIERMESQSLGGWVRQEVVMAFLDIESPETMRLKRHQGLKGKRVGNQWLYRLEDLSAYFEEFGSA